MRFNCKQVLRAVFVATFVAIFVFCLKINVYADNGVTPQKYKGAKPKVTTQEKTETQTETSDSDKKDKADSEKADDKSGDKTETKTDENKESKDKSEEKVEAKAEEVKAENASPVGNVKSATGIVVYVNRIQNVVRAVRINADGSEDTLRRMVCSCAREGKVTPLGTFKTSNYYEWRLMVDGTYGRYAVRFNNHILFHSVPYLKQEKDSLEWDQYNLLGQPASLGCIRLAVVDAKWIYDNCPQGTTVVVYDDPNEVIAKPASITIPENSPNRGWDPTDPDINNPWND